MVPGKDNQLFMLLTRERPKHVSKYKVIKQGTKSTGTQRQLKCEQRAQTRKMTEKSITI